MAFARDLTIGLLNGVTQGITLALIALGLNLIFGLLEIINVAHGALYMLGAFLGWYTLHWTGNFYLALVVAPLTVGLLGMLVERVVLRPVEEDISMTLIITFGLMLIFEQGALMLFGPSTRTVQAPITASLQFFGLSYSAYRVSVAVLGVIIMGLLYLFLFRTRYGLWMRGVQQDRETARALGIPASRVYMWTFGMGSVLAALAGVLMAPIVGVEHLMGLDILAVAFIVVIVGGLGSLQGVLVVSLIYAIMESVGSVFFPPLEVRIVTLSIMIALVLIRPDGIFAGK